MSHVRLPFPTSHIPDKLRCQMLTAAQANQQTRAFLPGLMGIMFTSFDDSGVQCELPVQQSLMAPNGYLHAGSVVSLADSAAGMGCLSCLPEGASGFTTIELKSNHLGTARDGTLDCSSRPVHLGRTTQVWDSTVTHRESGKTVALFRCTQMILYPAPAS